MVKNTGSLGDHVNSPACGSADNRELAEPMAQRPYGVVTQVNIVNARDIQLISTVVRGKAVDCSSCFEGAKFCSHCYIVESLIAFPSVAAWMRNSYYK